MVELQRILSAILVNPLFVRTYIDIRIRNGGDKMAYSEGLISLAVDLALVGEQVELARIAMTRLADKGYSLSSPEMLEANETFSKLSTSSWRFKSSMKRTGMNCFAIKKRILP